MSKISRLYKLSKIARIFKLIRVIKLTPAIEKILNSLRFKSAMVMIVKFAILILFLIHITGCLWYFISGFDDDYVNSWVQKNGLTDKGIFEKYIAAIYFVLTVLLTIGFYFFYKIIYLYLL